MRPLALGFLPLISGCTTLLGIDGEYDDQRADGWTGPSEGQVELRVTHSADDVSERDEPWEVDAQFLVIGGWGARTLTGLRFTDVQIPRGAIVDSAALQAHSPQQEWIEISFDLAAEAVPDSRPFSQTSPPSTRIRTQSLVQHDSNVEWQAGQWIELADCSLPITEVLAQPEWRAGQALTLILEGTSGPFGWKSVSSFDADSELSARLAVSWRLPSQ